MMSSCIGDFSQAPGSRRSTQGGINRAPAVRCTLATVPKILETGSICPFGTTFDAETATASDTWLCNLARLGPVEAGILNPRRSATLAIAFYPAAIVAGWAFVSLTCTASPRIENAAVTHAVDRLAPSLTASIDATARPQKQSAANRGNKLCHARHARSGGGGRTRGKVLRRRVPHRHETRRRIDGGRGGTKTFCRRLGGRSHANSGTGKAVRADGYGGHG